MLLLRRFPSAVRRAGAAAGRINKSHAMSRRGLATNPWLSDKSLYPLLAISAATVAFAAWFGPMWLYKSPETQAPIRRRTTIVHKQAHEGVPISEDMYKKSVDMTKGIYRVTIKDAEGSKEGEEMGKRTEGK